MNLYSGTVLGTGWKVSIEANNYILKDGCTIFYNQFNQPVALYPTNRLIINEIIYDYDPEIDN